MKSVDRRQTDKHTNKQTKHTYWIKTEETFFTAIFFFTNFHYVNFARTNIIFLSKQFYFDTSIVTSPNNMSFHVHTDLPVWFIIDLLHPPRSFQNKETQIDTILNRRWIWSRSWVQTTCLSINSKSFNIFGTFHHTTKKRDLSQLKIWKV